MAVRDLAVMMAPGTGAVGTMRLAPRPNGIPSDITLIIHAVNNARVSCPAPN